MPLSTAIRLGSMLHPQCYGHLGVRDSTFRVLETCALGAAGEAGYDYDDLDQFVSTVLCPDCGCTSSVECIVTHLNDDHRWTRERIADQVEVWERAQEGAAPEAVAESVEVTA